MIVFTKELDPWRLDETLASVIRQHAKHGSALGLAQRPFQFAGRLALNAA